MTAALGVVFVRRDRRDHKKAGCRTPELGRRIGRRQDEQGHVAHVCQRRYRTIVGKIDPVKKITAAAAKAKHPWTTVCMGIYRDL
jgi:hypothetical protein